MDNVLEVRPYVQQDTILEKTKRVIKKSVKLIEEMEGRNYCVKELTCYALNIAYEVESFEPGNQL